MSWKAQAQRNGDDMWYDDPGRLITCHFATEDEAKLYAKNVFGRWEFITACRIVQSDEPVNASFVDGSFVRWNY